MKTEKLASKDPEERAKVMRVSEAASEWVEPPEPNQRPRRAQVPVLMSTIGDTVVWGIVDSGSQANIVSAAVAEATGLPILPLKGKSFSVTGVDGILVKCKAWIPNAKVHVSGARVETRADLHVVEGIDCDLLLGRPWAVDHEVGIQERPRGTYVSWKMNGVWYKLNVTLARDVERKRARRRRAIQARKDRASDTEAEALIALPVKVSHREKGTSYVPDSEEDRLAPDALEPSGLLANLTEPQEESIGEKEREEIVGWAKEKVMEWKKKWEEETGDADDEQDQDNTAGEIISVSTSTPEAEQAPPPNQLGQARGKRTRTEVEVSKGKDGRTESRKRKRTSHARADAIEVDKDLEEEFAKLVQEEVDDEEWEAFCVREGRRMASRDQKWL